MWRNKPTKPLAQRVLRNSCIFVLHFPPAKCVILREELLSLPSEILPGLSSLWEMHLLALCHRKIWVYGSWGQGVWPSPYLTFRKAATISAHSWPKRKGKFSYPMHKTAKSKCIESALQNLYHTFAMFHWHNSRAVSFTLQNTSGAIVEDRYVPEHCGCLVGLEVDGNLIRNAWWSLPIISLLFPFS